MKTRIAFGFALAAFASAVLAAAPKVVSEKTLTGFVNPESVGCDPKGKALYVGNFGAPKLDPAAKEGMGYISKLSLDGKVLEQKFLPRSGGEALHKPKGIWIRGDRLWVTDIDAVWIYDLKSKRGRKLAVPLGFANDPAVFGNALYVSDNRNDVLIKIEPADFLDSKAEKISTVFKGAGVSPNGLYPGKGRLLIGGFSAPDKQKAFWTIGKDGQPAPISLPIGRLDGLYEMKDGSLLSTNWDDGSLFHWTMAGGATVLAKGFKGPADFCVLEGAKGRMTVVVPDLVQSQVRLIELESSK
jgi:hypothetical protein